ncbi:hypothetical protein [Burkholderia territorii]|uniref:hypothetical protein n=1 Tax=Burkholderia territorii TaxID=1503055 RepID=UPI0007B9ACC9|nr:hypothetical protein [Burkholderia territorii]
MSAMLDTVPPILDGLKRAHPDLTVFVNEIDSVDAIPALEAGEPDVAFARVDGGNSWRAPALAGAVTADRTTAFVDASTRRQPGFTSPRQLLAAERRL